MSEALPGLSEPEAKEFHNQFRMGTWTFGAAAIVAHLLTWMWKPWF
jgi:light-harvesting complex 1 beta chain